MASGTRESLLSALDEVDYNSFRTTFHEFDLNGRTITRALLEDSDEQDSNEQDSETDRVPDDEVNGCSPGRLMLTTSECEESSTEKEGLTWRLDSTISHSDWSIRIIGESAATYNVHKTALSVGPRKSNLFVRLFQQSSTHPQTTFRDFSELESDALPVVLDYVYSGALAISTDNATAIHTLSHRLEINSLRSTSRSFWIKNLDKRTAPVYFDHSRQLRDSQILKAVSLCCVQNVDVLLDLDNDIDFVLSVLESPRIVPSLELSLVVAVFCKQNRRKLSSAVFYRLTVALKDQIDPKAAVALLQTQLSFLSVKDDTAKQKSLTIRCIDVVSKKWTSKKDQREILALLPHSSFRECFLERCLDAAREDHSALKKVQKQERREQTERNQHALHQNEELKKKVVELSDKSRQLQAEIDFTAEHRQRVPDHPQGGGGGNFLSAIITHLNKCTSVTK